MKRILMSILSACALAGLAGCATPENPKLITQVPEVKVSASNSMIINGRQAVVQGFEQCKPAHGVGEYLLNPIDCIIIRRGDTEVKVSVTIMGDATTPTFTLYEVWKVDRHVDFINLVRPSGELAGRLYPADTKLRHL
ncbi:hypothetical protein HNP46_004326 [Pseudomonas nitritireducens]|uniref:Lipoprotein n=1 Tax=Pseudomonas nitroreducens TaxID=46680 RepID=A0A7W7P3D0_PSENT|nr:hypothetical protein [Pseudomonas nitritireducens]MBB4865445.1 hypothetical protein [Pseudomonas nitritireducens]